MRSAKEGKRSATDQDGSNSFATTGEHVMPVHTPKKGGRQKGGKKGSSKGGKKK